MPATEQTWRNQKVLHVLFGVTSLILLIATLWMLLADSSREWKGFQKQARNIEISVNSYRTQQAEIEAKEYETKLQAALLTVRSQPVAAPLVYDFIGEWLSENDEEVHAKWKTWREAHDEELAQAAQANAAEAAAAAEVAAAAEEAVAAEGEPSEASDEEAAPAEEATTESEEEEDTPPIETVLTPEEIDVDLPAEMVQILEMAAEQAKLAEPAADLRKQAIQATVAAQQARETVMQLHTSAGSEEDLQTATQTFREKDQSAKDADEKATEAEEASAEQRDTLIDYLEDLSKQAAFQESSLLTRLKFRRADYDSAKAKVDLAIRDSLSEEAIAEYQAVAEEVKSGAGGVDELNRGHQAASEHRKDLQEILDAITSAEDAAQKDLDDNQAEQVRLSSLYTEQRSTYFQRGYPLLGKKWLELPILDAFGSPLTIDNLWTEGLTINNNFTDVRRFDRCTTCHQMIEKSAPGQPLEPGFAPLEELELVLLPPDSKPLTELDEDGNEKPLTLDQVYGMQLADAGILNSKDVTVAIVWPDSLAAKAFVLGNYEPGTEPEGGLMSADVITAVDGNLIQEKDQLRRYLLESVEWGTPLRIKVRRGFPNPYTTHPRLDLYASSMSPHPISGFGCTICHEGQGSATSFEWSSHTPNSPEQRSEWVAEHGWFDNHHWIYPMTSERFQESTCLKCHHDVVDLMPSERFPDPPAPQVVEGYELIRDYGCFGCHEINGYDGPENRIGPDMRAEPNYYAAAQQLWADPSILGWIEQDLTREDTINEVVFNPANSAARQELLQLLIEDSELETPILSPTSHSMADLLREVESPGRLRRAGPSVRYVGSKVGREFLYDWISQPSHFRPDTKMPQFFGLLDHMQEEIAERARAAAEHIAANTPADNAAMKSLATAVANGDTSLENRSELRAMVVSRAAELKESSPQQSESLTSLAEELVDDAERYEPVEILGIVEYLLARSQEFEYTPLPEDVDLGTPEEQIERGKIAFETRGCLACHQHEGFPEITATQGPNLSRIADKLELTDEVDGAAWLYTWLLDPSNYHVRTKMPDLFLGPATETNADGTTTETNAAADIAAFLLSDVTGWEPTAQTLAHLTVDSQALNDLTLENLKAAFYEESAREYLETGVPENLRDTLKGAEVELILADGVEELTDEQKLIYIGRRSIMKYGCSGCHDIPGFEDAKPIGTSLADWGRKDASRLAFEHVLEYIGHGHGGGGHGAHGAAAMAEHYGGEGYDADGHAAEIHDEVEHEEPLPEFYMMHLESHDRIGFLFQKLREPRSYDFRKNRNREYSERLRMPEFPFDNQQREAVATFVLGLVAEPPAEQFVFSPDERQRAIIEGRQVLDKYNCAGCHILEAEQWEIAYQPGSIPPNDPTITFPFILPDPTEAQIHASIEPDRQGLLHATLTGMPRLNTLGHPEIEVFDPEEEGYIALDEFLDIYELEPSEVTEENAQLAYYLELWEPAVIEGGVIPVKGVLPPITEDMLRRRRPTQGGDFTHYLLPRVIEITGEEKGSEAYGWLPPPLMGEGSKVQSDWMHDFLLNPYRIRPAALLRMPRFNMSSEEATALSTYFAAVDNAQYPYEAPQQRRPAHLAQSEEAYQVHLAEIGETGDRFGDTMEIVTDAAGCVSCHNVGDYSPGGGQLALAPDLAEVYERLRPEYLRRWIAKPDWILPYTPMPENIPYLPGTGFTRTAPGNAEAGEEEEAESTVELIYHGDSTAQLDALVDLLSNFDRYARQQTEISPLVQQAGSEEESGGQAEAAPEDAARTEPEMLETGSTESPLER